MKKYVFAMMCAVLSTLSWAIVESEVVSEDTSHHFVLQTGAFANSGLASAQAGRISLLGVPSKVVEITDEQGNIVRVVRSNRMPQKEAERLAERLEKEHSVPVLLMFVK